MIMKVIKLVTTKRIEKGVDDSYNAEEEGVSMAHFGTGKMDDAKWILSSWSCSCTTRSDQY